MPEHSGYVDAAYLDRVAARLKHLKELTYKKMRVAPGQDVLDLGCGVGADTIALAKIVGSTGSVVGVDRDPEMVAEASRRAQAAGVGAWTSHQKAEASGTGLEANRFDASRSERLFQHLQDPESALAELVRVTKPGGWIVVADPDWSTSFVDSDEFDIERRLTRFMGKRLSASPGRRHYRMFKEQGLEDVSAQQVPIVTADYAAFRYARQLDQVERAAVAARVINEQELQRWRSGLEKAGKAGTFFSGVSMFVAAGRKPIPS